MDENKWRYEQLKEKNANQDQRIEKAEERLDRLDKFMYKTIEQLKTIFNRLKDIEKTNKWVSQSFFYLILSGTIGAVFFFFQWLITSR